MINSLTRAKPRAPVIYMGTSITPRTKASDRPCRVRVIPNDTGLEKCRRLKPDRTATPISKVDTNQTGSREMTNDDRPDQDTPERAHAHGRSFQFADGSVRDNARTTSSNESAALGVSGMVSPLDGLLVPANASRRDDRILFRLPHSGGGALEIAAHQDGPQHFVLSFRLAQPTFRGGSMQWPPALDLAVVDYPFARLPLLDQHGRFDAVTVCSAYDGCMGPTARARYRAWRHAAMVLALYLDAPVVLRRVENAVAIDLLVRDLELSLGAEKDEDAELRKSLSFASEYLAFAAAPQLSNFHIAEARPVADLPSRLIAGTAPVPMTSDAEDGPRLLHVRRYQGEGVDPVMSRILLSNASLSDILDPLPADARPVLVHALRLAARRRNYMDLEPITIGPRLDPVVAL
jgi:hypothetical protein